MQVRQRKWRHSGHDFSGRDLRGKSFRDQDLTGADFSAADVHGADFTDAHLGVRPFTGLVILASALLISTAAGVVIGLFAETTRERATSSDWQISSAAGRWWSSSSCSSRYSSKRACGRRFVYSPSCSLLPSFSISFWCSPWARSASNGVFR